MKIKKGTELICVRRKRLKGDDENYSRQELELGGEYVVYSVENYYYYNELCVYLDGKVFAHKLNNFKLK